MTQPLPPNNPLELKIPPVIVVTFAALLMLATLLIIPSFPVPTIRHILLIIVPSIPAAIFGIAAITKFGRAKTTVNPTKPDTASTLVTTGIYAISRNPMYTALAFLLLAIATAIANTISLLILPAFILYLTRFQIIPEERALTKIFGPEYTAYQQKTRRWL